MDDLAHAGPARRVEQGARVLHRQGVIDAAVGKADPVRVVEGRDPLERRGQGRRVVEVEGPHLDLSLVRPRSGCPVSVRTRRPLGPQMAGDGSARVAEGAGDDVEAGVGTGPGSGRGGGIGSCGAAHGSSSTGTVAVPVVPATRRRSRRPRRPAAVPGRTGRVPVPGPRRGATAARGRGTAPPPHARSRPAPPTPRAASRRGPTPAPRRRTAVHGVIRRLTSAPSPGVDADPAIISTSRAASPVSRSSRRHPGGQLHQGTRTPHVGQRRLVAPAAIGAHLVEGGQQQGCDRTEVVEDQALVAARPGRHRPRRGRREPLVAQDVHRCGDQGTTGVARASRRPAGAARSHHPPAPFRLPGCRRSPPPEARSPSWCGHGRCAC